MGTIPGYLATISIDGDALNVFSSEASLSQTKEILDKTTLGVVARVKIGGLTSAIMEVSMHTDDAGMVDIQAAYAAVSELAFVFRPGALGTHDAGEYTGFGVVSDLTINGQVDDNWSTSLTIETTGPVPYTPPV